jgi:hypothetical protein
MRARQYASTIISMLRSVFPEAYNQHIHKRRKAFVAEHMPSNTFVAELVIGSLSFEMQTLFALSTFFSGYNPYCVDLSANKQPERGASDGEFYKYGMSVSCKALEAVFASLCWELILRQPRYRKLRIPGTFFFVNREWKLCRGRVSLEPKETRKELRWGLYHTRERHIVSMSHGNLWLHYMFTHLERTGRLPFTVT